MSSQSLLLHPATITCSCPSCRSYVIFTLIGIQTWPLRVVQQSNLPPQMGLYSCPQCRTSASEPELLKSQSV